MSTNLTRIIGTAHVVHIYQLACLLALLFLERFKNSRVTYKLNIGCHFNCLQLGVPSLSQSEYYFNRILTFDVRSYTCAPVNYAVAGHDALLLNFAPLKSTEDGHKPELFA